MICSSQRFRLDQYSFGSDLALEFLHALNHWPLEVVQNTRTVQEQIAGVFEQPCRTVRLCLLKLDKPFALILVPITTNDFRFEGHIFPQAPDIAHLV